MKKMIFVESVFNRIYGGRPSTDFSVLKVDIIAFLPAVVNFALTKGFYTQKNQEGNGDLPTQFYHTYRDIPILRDTDKKQTQYFTPPVDMVALPSDRGLRRVMDNCGNIYIPVPDQLMPNMDYWLKVFCGEKYFNQDGKKIKLYNTSPLAKTMSMTGITSADQIDDDDELAIPAGQEQEALDMCYDLAMGIRKVPTDTKIDTQDII